MEDRKRVFVALEDALKSRHGRLFDEDYLRRMGVTREHFKKVARGERPGLSEEAARGLGTTLVNYGLQAKDCLCFLSKQSQLDSSISKRILSYIEAHADAAEEPEVRPERVEFSLIDRHGRHATYSLPLNGGNQTLSFSHGEKRFTVTIQNDSKA